MSGRRLLFGCVLVGMVLALGTGCQSNTKPAPPVPKTGTRILCSFYPIYLFTKAVVGDAAIPGSQPVANVTVELLLPAGGGCPHGYQLSTADAKTLANADLFVCNGGGLEPFLNKINNHNPNIKLIDTSLALEDRLILIGNGADQHNHGHEHEAHDHKHEGHGHEAHDHDHDHDHADKATPSAKAKSAEKDHDHQHEHEEHAHAPASEPKAATSKHDHDHDHAHEGHDHGHDGHKHDHDHAHEGHDHVHVHGHEGHDHGTFNPHFFSSPECAAIQVKYIAEQLSQQDPANADRYRQNAKLFAEQLEQLAAEFRAAGEKFQKRKIVTMHEIFDYLFRSCKVEVVAQIHAEPGYDPGARAFNELVKTIKAEGVAAIFTEPQYRKTSANNLSEETKVPLFELDPLASGKQTDSPAHYLEVMRQNLDKMRTALGQ